MKIHKTPILMFTIFLLSGCATIPKKVWRPPVDSTLNYGSYLIQDSTFVAVPTITGYVVGAPLGLLTWSLAPLSEITKEDEIEDSHIKFFIFGSAIVGNITGTPFLIVKKVLWDFPAGVVKTENGEKKAEIF